MLAKIWLIILRLLGRIGNPVKTPETDASFLPEKDAVKFLPEADLGEEKASSLEVVVEDVAADIAEGKPIAPPSKVVEPKVLTEWELRWELIEEMLNRPFDGPLDKLPVRRYSKTVKRADGSEVEYLGVYDVYGRAPKEKGNKKYPKAKLKVHENLSGDWNNNKPRLYMEIHVGEYFREGLARCAEFEERTSGIIGKVYKVLSYLYSIGAFSHRHIRHNLANQLSYHSWALAFDQNPGWNRAVPKHHKWQKRIKRNGKAVWINCPKNVATRGPIHRILPYSKQFFEVWPKAAPLELFIAFTSVGFSCGMNWGRMKWLEVVRKHGIGYDQNEVKDTREFWEAMNEWKSSSFADGMHYELTNRGEWEVLLWQKHQNLINEGKAA